MILRPFHLERELDRAVAQWLAWLPRWDPMLSAGREGVCAVCPRWTGALGLAEVPHGPVHALVTSVDAVVAEHFQRTAHVQYPGLGHSWRVTLEDGEVRIAPVPAAVAIIDAEDGDGVEAEGPPLTVAEAFVARVDLTKLYESITEAAVARVRTHHDDMVRLIAVTVDRRVQRMVDELAADLADRDIA